VAVVSGLARGIDSAAHAGALGAVGAPVLGVLGAALGTPISPAAAALQQKVRRHGALLSEVAPGTAGARWNFAVRNRIMAALAHAVVVVEAHRRSGAHHTVQAALARGIFVGAVPGSIRSAASVGTNDLLAAGAHPVRGVDDVVAALHAALASRPAVALPRPVPPPAPPRHRRPPTALAAQVAGALGPDPAALDQLALRSGLDLGDLALGLEQLAAAGLAEEEGGWWSRPRRTP
jgi:DNA processing protein